MSDQSQSDECLTWGVDWAAYKTWLKFVAVSTLVAAAVLGCNLLAVAGLRLVAQFTRGGELPANFELWNVGGAFPFLLELAVFLIPWLVFVIPFRLFARRTSSAPLPGDFPMEVFESSRSKYSGWWMLILLLYLNLAILYGRLDSEFFLFAIHNQLTYLVPCEEHGTS